MDSSSLVFCEYDPALAGRQFSSRAFSDLGGVGLTSRGIRRAIANGPHDSTSAAHDRRASSDSTQRAGHAAIARLATPLGSICHWPIVSMAAAAADRPGT